MDSHLRRVFEPQISQMGKDEMGQNPPIRVFRGIRGIRGPNRIPLYSERGECWPEVR